MAALPVYDVPPLLESWYADLVKRYSPEGKVVVKDAGGALGRGLYALVDLKAGTPVVVNEEPLALIPDLHYDPEISCAHCLRPLADLALHIRRMTAAKSGDEAPFDASTLHPDVLAQVASLTGTAPVRCKGGCGCRYCCEGHSELAWASYHRLLCPIADKTGNIAAFIRLSAAASDRLMLGATVLARVICASEAGGGDMQRAWEPFALMKGMPWERQLAYDEETDSLADEGTTKKQLMRTALEALTPVLCIKDIYKPLFRPAFFSRILGMIDMNACMMGVFSPVECYLIAASQLPAAKHAEAEKAFAPMLRLIRARTGTEDGEGLPKVEGVGLFPLQMIVNHSCEPNGESLSDIDGRVSVVLIRDVAAGQEILNSYRDFTDKTPFAQRQRQLRAQFNFECRCTRCTRDRTTKP